MEINLPTPEEINRQITESIAKSAIGEELEKLVKEQIKKIGTSWNNPYETIVQQYINDEIRTVIREHHQETIKEKVVEQMTDEMIQKVVDATFERAARTY